MSYSRLSDFFVYRHFSRPNCVQRDVWFNDLPSCIQTRQLLLLIDASNVNCLCIIQRKVVRLICNADRLAHTNELFKELYILKFPKFVQYKTAILMFHLFHGTLPIHLQNRFSRYSTTRSTRRINTFVMVQARTNITAMCLSVSGVKLWNSLSNNLRDCNSVIIFKKNLKKYLISIY